MVRVKICCIASVEEIRLATQRGAHTLGFVSEMPSGPGVLTDRRIADLAAQVPPGVGRFLLTQHTDPGPILEQVRATGADTVQICDHVDVRVLDAVRTGGPARVVAVVHVEDERSVCYARQAAQAADALLLDSGRPGADFKELGGTGRVHDWGISQRIVDEVDVPVWLAGGLNPNNVRAAIERVRPFGVDLCTGVRRHGVLDADLLRAFMLGVAG